jgi:hypothetical protein
MSKNGRLICIGSYHPNIANDLDYMPMMYEDTPIGSKVMKSLFVCDSTKQTRWLANQFGFDLFDFSKHHFNNYQLRNLVERVEFCWWDDDAPLDAQEDWKRLEKFAYSDFIAHFEPEV